jgi:hypothetical protein
MGYPLARRFARALTAAILVAGAGRFFVPGSLFAAINPNEADDSLNESRGSLTGGSGLKIPPGIVVDDGSFSGVRHAEEYVGVGPAAERSEQDSATYVDVDEDGQVTTYVDVDEDSQAIIGEWKTEIILPGDERSDQEIPLPTRRPEPNVENRTDAQERADADGAAGSETNTNPKRPARRKAVPKVEGKGVDLTPEQRRKQQEQARQRVKKTPEQLKEELRKKELEARERDREYEKINKTLRDLWDQKNDDLDKGPDPRRKAPPGLAGGGAGGGLGAGGAGGGAGGKGKGPRQGTGRSGEMRAPGRLRRAMRQLSHIPGTESAFRKAGVRMRNGRLEGTEAQLIAAQNQVSKMPLVAMMRHPGILNTVGAGDAVTGREKYEKVRATVESGEGGEETVDIGTHDSDRNSLVFTATKRRGLDSGFNDNHESVLYTRGETVPGKTVANIYDSLFSSEDGESSVKNAQAKLGGSVFGNKGGGGVWSRLKGAFASLLGGGEGREAGAAPRLAGAMPSGVVGARGAGAGRLPLSKAPRRGLGDSRIPDRVGLVEYEAEGSSTRSLVWGVSGALGFSILLYWAWRGRKED